MACRLRSQLARGTISSPAGQTLGRALSPLGDQGGESQCRHQGRRGVWTAGVLDIRRSLSPSGDQGGSRRERPEPYLPPQSPRGGSEGGKKIHSAAGGVGK